MKTHLHSCLFASMLMLTIFGLCTSCIPERVREKMDDSMKVAQTMLADQDFKKAIALIELHKVRNGTYPKLLNDLQFLSVMDSSMLRNVEYFRLDSGYELNINLQFPDLAGVKSHPLELNYPEEFWTGLGCVKSNVRQ